MSETDILNPVQGWDPALGDSMNPSYGFTMRRPTTLLQKKAVGGSPWTRETQNSGHVFSLSWVGRTFACVQRVRRYYEQYEDGYFTIIDWDGGGRHYVGRFTTEPVVVENANDKWDAQNVTFEEMPRAPMVQYPSDWTNDAVVRYAVNDFGDLKVASSGTWTPTARTISGVARTTLDNPGNANEWAQYEYRGYGFQLYLMQGPEYGQAQVLLDGTLVATVDCYAATDNGPQIVTTQLSVPLDIHRVQVIALGTKNASATAATISWYALEVMR